MAIRPWAKRMQSEADVLRTSSTVMRTTAGDLQAAQKSFAEMNDAIVAGLAKLPGGELFSRFRMPR